MKRTNNLAILFAFTALVVSACSTTPFQVDDKYRFSEYETVDSITNHRISGWESIDNQSLIVQTSPSTYYLVVLRNKIYNLNFSEGISFTSTGTQVQARFDCVQIRTGKCLATDAAPIDTIYKLDDRAAVQHVKQKIRGS